MGRRRGEGGRWGVQAVNRRVIPGVGYAGAHGHTGSCGPRGACSCQGLGQDREQREVPGSSYSPFSALVAPAGSPLV